MKAGMIGLGKLGLPVATAMAARGIQMFGYDPLVRGYPDDLSYEDGFAELRDEAERRMAFCSSIAQVVENATTVFVAVQTPHDPRFEGTTPLPDVRADFDYSYLREAVAAVADAAFHRKRHVTVSVISTVLPGTMAREIAPLLGQYASLVYNPSFIAMGTTIRDFLDPEFVLLGGDQHGQVDAVYEAIYGLDGPRRVRTTVENAELIKVSYNTFIGLKIAFANTLMEVCHKTGCDVDEVTGALKLAHRRLISPAYMDGGMGDGGGCHPRDNIALSWLARELDLSHDLFEDAMVAREDQASWLASMLWRESAERDLPIGILGLAYKPSSHITTGSPARLVVELLKGLPDFEPPDVYDPHVGATMGLNKPHVYLVGCKHPEFQYALDLPPGSVVIDPFRYIPDADGIEVIRLGEGQRPLSDHWQARDGATLPSRAA